MLIIEKIKIDYYERPHRLLDIVGYSKTIEIKNPVASKIIKTETKTTHETTIINGRWISREVVLTDYHYVPIADSNPEY